MKGMTIVGVALMALSWPGLAWAGPPRVAAAISLREALTQVGADYRAKTGIQVEFVFGSSGQLMAQIENGAPIDAFVSAGRKQTDDLAAAGLTDGAAARVVAGNSMVLIVPADAPPGNVTSFQDLLKPTIQRVAVGEPTTVPAGLYAAQTLQSLHLGKPLAPKIIYGLNVRQVLDYVERGEVDAGLVYATDVREAGNRVRVAATAPATAHEPIVYPAVILKSAAARRQARAARDFLDYLASDPGHHILSTFGFTDGKPPATMPATAP